MARFGEALSNQQLDKISEKPPNEKAISGIMEMAHLSEASSNQRLGKNHSKPPSEKLAYDIMEMAHPRGFEPLASAFGA